MLGFELNILNTDKLNNNTIVIKNYAIFNNISTEIGGALNFDGKFNCENNIKLYPYYCFNRQQLLKKAIWIGNKLYEILDQHNDNIETILYRNILNILGSNEIYSTIKYSLKEYGYPYKIDTLKFENYYKNIKKFEDTDITLSFNVMDFVQDIIEIYIIFESLNKIRTLDFLLNSNNSSNIGYDLKSLNHTFKLVNQYQKIINIMKNQIPKENYLADKKQIKEIIYINSKINFDIDLLDTQTDITEKNILEKLHIFEKVIFSFLNYKIQNDKNCNVSYNELILLEKKEHLKYFTTNIYNSIIGFCYNELKYILINMKPCKNPKCSKLLPINDKKIYCSDKCQKEGRKIRNALYYAKNKKQE